MTQFRGTETTPFNLHGLNVILAFLLMPAAYQSLSTMYLLCTKHLERHYGEGCSESDPFPDFNKTLESHKMCVYIYLVTQPYLIL